MEETAGPGGRAEETAGPVGRAEETAGPSGRAEETAGPGGRAEETAGPGGRAEETQYSPAMLPFALLFIFHHFLYSTSCSCTCRFIFYLPTERQIQGEEPNDDYMGHNPIVRST